MPSPLRLATVWLREAPRTRIKYNLQICAAAVSYTYRPAQAAASTISADAPHTLDAAAGTVLAIDDPQGSVRSENDASIL